MTPRPLAPLPCPTGDAVLELVLPPLAAALAGDGPAVVPVPDGPPGDAVRRMARLDEPVGTAADSAVASGARPDAAEIALVVPTSGSTGDVKGALLPATALRHSATATLDRLGGPGRWLLALPTTHIAGLQVLVRSIVAGVTPGVLDLAGGFHPDAFAAATATLGEGRRYTALVPTQLRRLVDAGGDALAALASYDGVLLGGAATPPDLLEAARAAGVAVVTTYGMSETAGGCVYDGRALDGVAVAIAEDGRVRLGGPVVFAGYRGRPDLTAEALAVDSSMRWHLTRDLGELHDGVLEVLGRADDVVVTGGEKVAPLLVERALAAHPGLREVAVLGVPDPEWGERVVAVVVAADEMPTVDELRAWAAGRLPSYALPRQVVQVGAVPLLASGKPDRAALRALAADRMRA